MKGDVEQFELAENWRYRGKSQCNFDQGRGNLELELSRFYCNL